MKYTYVLVRGVFKINRKFLIASKLMKIEKHYNLCFLTIVTRYVDALLAELYPSLESLGEVVFGDGSQYPVSGFL